MKNSTLIFILIAFVSESLLALFNLHLALFILGLVTFVYLFYCLTECIDEDYGNEKYEYDAIPKKYNIISIITDFLNSFPQIIKKKITMPDISMCPGKDCPLKETCYRFKAKPSEYQSYFVYPPYNVEEKKCDSYWENKK